MTGKPIGGIEMCPIVESLCKAHKVQFIVMCESLVKLTIAGGVFCFALSDFHTFMEMWLAVVVFSSESSSAITFTVNSKIVKTQLNVSLKVTACALKNIITDTMIRKCKNPHFYICSVTKNGSWLSAYKMDTKEWAQQIRYLTNPDGLWKSLIHK